MKYAFIEQQREKHTLERLCAVLEVSTSGYHAWRKRPVSPRESDNRRLVEKIRIFHQASRRTYGSPRIHKDLMEIGETCGENRVARLMRAEGIQSKMTPKFVITTDSRNTTAPAPDLLQRDFTAATPNQRWVSDTTFIATRQGWLFLAVILDLYSRQVVGWAMGNRNTAQLVQDALVMALWRRGQVTGLVLHSDQGSTYNAGAYQQLLQAHQLQCSMSRKGECLDNAVAESFFGTLKTELTNHEDYYTHAQAKQSLFEYIEVFYNRQRRHSTLGYLSPAEFERRYVSI